MYLQMEKCTHIDVDLRMLFFYKYMAIWANPKDMTIQDMNIHIVKTVLAERQITCKKASDYLEV